MSKEIIKSFEQEVEEMEENKRNPFDEITDRIIELQREETEFYRGLYLDAKNQRLDESHKHIEEIKELRSELSTVKIQRFFLILFYCWLFIYNVFFI